MRSSRILRELTSHYEYLSCLWIWEELVGELERVMGICAVIGVCLKSSAN